MSDEYYRQVRLTDRLIDTIHAAACHGKLRGLIGFLEREMTGGVFRNLPHEEQTEIICAFNKLLESYIY